MNTAQLDFYLAPSVVLCEQALSSPLLLCSCKINPFSFHHQVHSFQIRVVTWIFHCTITVEYTPITPTVCNISPRDFMYIHNTFFSLRSCVSLIQNSIPLVLWQPMRYWQYCILEEKECSYWHSVSFFSLSLAIKKLPSVPRLSTGYYHSEMGLPSYW